MSLGSAVAKVGNSLAKASKTISSKASSFGSTTAGKVVKTGAAVGTAAAAVGAGTMIAGNAVGAGLEGVSKGVESFEDNTGVGRVVKTITGGDTTDTTAKAAMSYVTIGLVIGIILLMVFVVVPKVRSKKK